MSRKRKVALERRIELVQRCLCGKISISEAGREAEVNFETVKDWIQRYEAEGIAGFQHKKNKYYPSVLKEKAVREYQQGKGSQRDICNKFGIRNKKQLQSWIKVYPRRARMKSTCPPAQGC